MKSSLEEMLGTIHLPQKVFGDSALELVLEDTGFKIYFNTLDARVAPGMPPAVEVPAASKWKFRTYSFFALRGPTLFQGFIDLLLSLFRHDMECEPILGDCVGGDRSTSLVLHGNYQYVRASYTLHYWWRI